MSIPHHQPTLTARTRESQERRLPDLPPSRAATRCDTELMPLSDDLRFALDLADLADGISLQRFAHQDFNVHLKADGSPVTDVDIAVEKALLASVRVKYPDDAFLGEEVGKVGASTSLRRWIARGWTAQRRSRWAADLGGLSSRCRKEPTSFSG